MTEHISDEYFVTREVVTYNGSALVSGEKDLVVEECYQLVCLLYTSPSPRD